MERGREGGVRLCVFVYERERERDLGTVLGRASLAFFREQLSLPCSY